MVWKVELSKLAEKELNKLDRQSAIRILEFLRDRLSKVDNPRLLGESLKGAKFGEFWKYRVGNYRIICEINDRILSIFVIKIGHRREVYK